MSWKDKLIGMGASPPPAPEPEPIPEPAPIPVASAETLAWGADIVRLMGEAEALRTLRRANGTNQGRQAVDGAIQRALDGLKRREAATYNLPPLGGRKGVPTFERELYDVLAAIESGAVDAYVAAKNATAKEADKVEIPTALPEESLDAFRNRLELWADEQTGAVLRHLKFDVYEIVNALERARRAEAEVEAQAHRDSQARLFVEKMLAAERSVGSSDPEEWWRVLSEARGERYSVKDHERQAYLAASASPWAARYMLDGYAPPPSKLPSSADEARVPTQVLLHGEGPQSPVVREVLGRRFGFVSAGVIDSGDTGKAPALWTPGKVTGLYGDDVYSAEDIGVTRPLGTSPHPDGWANGDVYVPPRIFESYKRAAHYPMGAVRVEMAIADRIGIHPDKGYPRLFTSVSAGSQRATIEIPISDRGGEILQRCSDAVLLNAFKLPVPTGCLRMDLAVGQTQAGNPRLEASDHATPGVLCLMTGATMSAGRHGINGRSDDVASTGHKGGARLLKEASARSRGGGLTGYRAVAFIPIGGTLAMSTGAGLRCESDLNLVKIPGGGL